MGLHVLCTISSTTSTISIINSGILKDLKYDKGSGKYPVSLTHSFTPFLSFTAYFTNSISQIIIHPKNMQFMERLVFFLLSWVLQLAIFQI